MYHPIYLKKLREACDRYGVHLIADEIAVGFGRTGTWFACEQAQISPDFMCLSKGLTGGYLPLCAVLTTQNVFDAFYHSYDSLKGFLHSHSFTGNPLACSVSLATIDILQQEHVIQNNQKLSQVLSIALSSLRDHPNVAEVRQTGMVAAVELVKDKPTKTPFPWQERRGLKVYQAALKKGALLRPLGDVIYFMPPYVITPEEIKKLVNIAMECIHEAVK